MEADITGNSPIPQPCTSRCGRCIRLGLCYTVLIHKYTLHKVVPSVYPLQVEYNSGSIYVVCVCVCVPQE